MNWLSENPQNMFSISENLHFPYISDSTYTPLFKKRFNMVQVT